MTTKSNTQHTLVRFSWDKQAECSCETISCNLATTSRGVACAARRYFSWISLAKFLIFNFCASTFDTNRFPLFPNQPAANSGPKDVSALNVCFVPLFDSKTKPARSSRRMVACCPSALCTDTSLSLVHVRDQLPTESRVEPGDDSRGWLGVPSFTWPRALWSFSRNSPLLSGKVRNTRYHQSEECKPVHTMYVVTVSYWQQCHHRIKLQRKSGVYRLLRHTTHVKCNRASDRMRWCGSA